MSKSKLIKEISSYLIDRYLEAQIKYAFLRQKDVEIICTFLVRPNASSVNLRQNYICQILFDHIDMFSETYSLFGIKCGTHSASLNNIIYYNNDPICIFIEHDRTSYEAYKIVEAWE